MPTKETESPLRLTMASDAKYVPYLRTAIQSIRRYNSHLPIDVYSCAKIGSLFTPDGINSRLHEVDVSQKLKVSLAEGELEHASTRVAKLESMNQRGSDNLMYVDSDIIALDDPEKITAELPVSDSDRPVVYMLLRRPQLLSIADIGWLYFKNSSKLSPQQMADLINDTFSTDYSANRLQDLRCWNGGIVYGSTEGVNILANLWKEHFLKMLTGRNRGSFIPNDQLCLWLVADRLKRELTIRELPLAWNFMPGHTLEEVMEKTDPDTEEIKQALAGVKILHFAQNKTDKWVQLLYR